MSVRDFHPDFVVKRATVLPQWDDATTVANLKYIELDGFAGIKVFSCHRLNASLTAASCASSFADAKYMACVGCPIGPIHLAANPVSPETMDRYEKSMKDGARWDRNKGLACIRCERTEATATRFVGRFRLVKQTTLCINCFNRQREVERGANGKGAKPVKHAGLRPATITIEINSKRETLDIGLRMGYLECARYVERVHPGATLIETAIDGEIIPQFSLWTPLPFSPWAPKSQPQLKLVKPKALRVANDREAAQAEDNPLKPRKSWLPPMTPEQASAYKKSFENDESITPRGRGLVEDITSERFGRLTVIESDEDELICDYWRETSEATLPAFVAWLTDSRPAPVAGDVKTVAESDVQSEFHGNVDDITGRRFGLLSVIARDGSDPRGHAAWRVRCDCGSETIIRATDMKTRKQVSCGCFFDAAIRQRKRNTGPLTESEIVEWNERVGTKRPEPVVGGLTWRGRALAEIAAERGEDLAVIESRMLATGSPFPDTRKAVRPPPQLAHNESAVPSDPVSDAIAPAKPVESVVEPPVEPQVSKKPEPAVSKRALHPLLVRLGFRVAVLYGSVMPLAIEQYRGPKSLVLFGCLCSKTFYAPAQAVLRGHTKDCGCGIKPEAPKPSHDLAAYLRALRPMPPIKLHMGTTHENHVAVGVRAYVRSSFVTR